LRADIAVVVDFQLPSTAISSDCRLQTTAVAATEGMYNHLEGEDVVEGTRMPEEEAEGAALPIPTAGRLQLAVQTRL